jgi:S-adenosylmethionine synthetase
MAYAKAENPKVAGEVLIGHGRCHIINETDTTLLGRNGFDAVHMAVERIAGECVSVDYREYKQDKMLAENQKYGIRCGDNGIFKGCPTTEEQAKLSTLMRQIYDVCPHDGKACVFGDALTLCQSHTADLAYGYRTLREITDKYYELSTINPLGPWAGGLDVDTGATNRKLGSDMGDAVTGGGLHGKDLSKADVSVNIMCHILAQQEQQSCSTACSIGDDDLWFFFEDGFEEHMTYDDVVEKARRYVADLGGFEKLAEWGLI